MNCRQNHQPVGDSDLTSINHTHAGQHNIMRADGKLGRYNGGWMVWGGGCSEQVGVAIQPLSREIDT